MKVFYPNYYKKFKCIAGNCKDTCCKCWEIDIDSKTLDFYKNVSGEFGEKLKENIDFGINPHIIFNKSNYCPFLNSNNLCDVFINLGEKNMCNICTEHPRFYEWYDNEKEAGLGLCCEEVARIILEEKEPFSYFEEINEEDNSNYIDENLYSYLKETRNQFFNYINNSNINSLSILKNILLAAEKIQENLDGYNYNEIEIQNNLFDSKKTITELLQYFTTLIPFSNSWINYLNNSAKNTNYSKNDFEKFLNATPEINQYIKNISTYFIWRYYLKGVFDEEILSKIKLMYISTILIYHLFFIEWTKNKSIDLNTCIEITKNYSKEIEYCLENIDKITNDCYELELLSTENLLNII